MELEMDTVVEFEWCSTRDHQQAQHQQRIQLLGHQCLLGSVGLDGRQPCNSMLTLVAHRLLVACVMLKYILLGEPVQMERIFIGVYHNVE